MTNFDGLCEHCRRGGELVILAVGWPSGRVVTVRVHHECIEPFTIDRELEGRGVWEPQR